LNLKQENSNVAIGSKIGHLALVELLNKFESGFIQII
jgi:hypothetical protein